MFFYGWILQAFLLSWRWILGAGILFVFYVAGLFIGRYVRRRIGGGRPVHDPSFFLIERVILYAIVVVGFVMAAGLNGLDFTLILGAISLGIIFSMKDIFSNFVSGIVILSRKTMCIGNLISVEGVRGKIADIGFRTTLLESLDGSRIIVPNHLLLDAVLVDYGYNPFRRMDFMVSVSPETDFFRAAELVRSILRSHPDILPKPESLVIAEGFSDGVLLLHVYFWLESSAPFLKIRSAVLDSIKRVFDENGIVFPLSPRRIHLDEDDCSFLKTAGAFSLATNRFFG